MEELGQCSTVSDQFTAQFGTLFPTLTRTATEREKKKKNRRNKP